MPGVTITLTNQATNAVREVQTNESGLYVMPALLPGLYTLKATLGGFRTHERRDIEVQVGSAHRIAVTMEVGERTEVVEITGGAPLLETANSAVGTVIENRAIVELPLNGRNYLQLASLMPGATTNGPSSSQGKQRMGGQRNSFALNVAGQRIHYNHYSLDGVENTDLNFNSYLLLPSVDALQEFNVVAGLFDAEYGRAIAQINASTKSGTNSVPRHGVRVRAQLRARREELLRPRRSAHPAVPAEPVRRDDRRTGHPAEGDRRHQSAVLPVQLGGPARNEVAHVDALGAAHRLARRRLLEPARRQRQPHPHLRSGDARLRRGRQRDSGADGVPGQSHSGEPHPSGVEAVDRLLSAAAAGSDRRELRERRGAQRGRRSVHVSPRLHAERERELVLPPQHLARAGLRSVRDSRHGDQHRHRRASGRARLHAHVRIEQAERSASRLQQAVQRPHLPARQRRQRGRPPRHQPAERQSALLGRAEHRHHRARGHRRGKRRAVHQRRHDVPDRRQLHVDRVEALVQVRRRTIGACATTRSAAS